MAPPYFTRSLESSSLVMIVEVLCKVQYIYIYIWRGITCYITIIILSGADEHTKTSQTSFSTVLLNF